MCHRGRFYTAEKNVITGTCKDEDGGHGKPKTATLTLKAPELTKFGENDKSENAKIEGSIDGVTNPEIKYYKKQKA